jgi:GDPmannose 4,6-dehydratase
VATAARTALITGLTGQDGSFLAELLLGKGYAVTGMVRGDAWGASEHLRGRVEPIRGDLLEPRTLSEAVRVLRPDELYHLAAPSFVPDSWARPAETFAAISEATATFVEAVRSHSPTTRVFLAASGAMFGATGESPQHEETPCWPQNPYAAAKLAAHNLVGQFRRHEYVYACSGILYNHESERRPESFVPRKITSSVAAIKLGRAEEVLLGNLDAVRDWSFAGDIMRGAWLTLQQEHPDDYILASGIGRTVAELADVAFGYAGLCARNHVRVDPDLVRPVEATPVVGDPTRARERLGWAPELSFEELIGRMVEADLQALGRPN